jgi:hypothetical protein
MSLLIAKRGIDLQFCSEFNHTTMKSRLYLLILFSFFTVHAAYAQWSDVQNKNINFEFRVNESYYAGSNDTFGDPADPTIRTDVWLSDGGWIGELCSSWNCSSPCNSTSANWIWYSGSGYSWDTEFALWIEAFESDNSNECVYTSGDDEYFSGLGTLRDNQDQIRIVYPSTDFYPCNWNNWLAGNGSQWCFQQTSVWDQRWGMTWRYSAGNSDNSTLNFGVVGNGETKSDFNSNRAVSTSSGTELQYDNTAGNSSPDVWYSFQINESSLVTISTVHGETDFDTVLVLYDANNNVLSTNDDASGTLQSTISTGLCAGTYKFRVEGFSTNTGVFKVSVGASAVGVPTAADFGIDHATCADSQDGYAGWWVNGGIAPFSFTWEGSVISAPSQSNLNPGTYQISVSDACGASSNTTVTIENADNEAPDAQCSTPLEIDIVEGNNYTFTTSMIDAGSTDNCGIESMSIWPSILGSDDDGFQDIELTVTDTNGNTSTCTTTVFVSSVVGIETYSTSEDFKVFPNPGNGVLTLEYTATSFPEDALLKVFSATGKEVFAQTLRTLNGRIDLSGLARGTYYLMVPMHNGHVSRTLIIQD